MQTSKNQIRIPHVMRAMVIHETVDLAQTNTPLSIMELPVPEPSPRQLLIRVSACGICHTELDEIEGRTPPSFYPMIPGHQVVGTVYRVGEKVQDFLVGERVGVAWFFSSCGHCEYCLSGYENLCKEYKATGRDAWGGYADFMSVPATSVVRIPEGFSDAEAAPLLCAGAIGYRSIRLTGIRNGQLLGLTGFGASAHLVMKMIPFMFPDTRVYVFARSLREQAFARELGAVWAGDITDIAPERLHAIIDTTPVWRPVIEALVNLRPGGRLIINAIRKENTDIHALLQMNYTDHVWMEKEIKSVANVTRNDVEEFLALAGRMSIKPEIQLYSLDQTNDALVELKQGKIQGAKVIHINSKP